MIYISLFLKEKYACKAYNNCCYGTGKPIMASVTKKTDNAHTYESYDKCHNLTYPALAGSDVYNFFLTIYSMFYLMLGHSENTFGSVMQDILICFEILRGRKRAAKSLSLHHGRESVGYNGTLFRVFDILENLVKIHRGRMVFINLFRLILCFFFHNAFREYLLIAVLIS